MAKKLAKPRFAEAGPGAGKTHAMVDEITAASQVLPPHRFLAAITYTNAAANTIKERLSTKVQIRRNIFIGTTHSFVNRFILAPCAELQALLPADRIYAPIPVHEKGRGAAIYSKNLIKKGIIPYDSMVPMARKILENPATREHICGRLAYMFVDEFQDVDIAMLNVFEHFRKAEKTQIYVVGDPEQYVMSFTYRGTKPPTFDKIPFVRFKKVSDFKPISENYRSNGEIVTFANQFRENLEQKPVKPFRNEPRILFIPNTVLTEIIEYYQALSSNIEIKDKKRTRLYLSEENATFDTVCDQYQITPVSNVDRKTKSLLGDALELLAVALDRSQRKVCEEFGLSRLQWRSIGTRLLKDLKVEHYGTNHLIKLVADEFNHKVSKSRIRLIEDGLRPLIALLSGDKPSNKTEICASIRKAKGLQADAALVVAKSETELKKWLQTERSTRSADKQDKCRLGYVAFTRPREMLCIACLKEADAELIQMLQSLGVVIIDAYKG